MPDYKTMYLHLFNQITDAISALNALNFGQTQEILKRAQIEAEEQYVSEEDHV